jgi:hypothetical protein
MFDNSSDQGSREIDAMAKVWIEEHWGLEWPGGLDPDTRPQVLTLMRRLREALHEVRTGDRQPAE